LLTVNTPSGADEAMQAARQAGAFAAALSGAGPGIVAFCRGSAEAVGQAMVAAFRQAGVPARHWALRVAQQGYQLRGLHG
jgi:homoserine kinase